MLVPVGNKSLSKPEDIRRVVDTLRVSMLNEEGHLPGERRDETISDHLMAHGTYTRVFRASAGDCVVGQVHKYSVINVLLEGKVRVVAEDTGAVEITAPHYWVGPPGVQRALFVLEDITWLCTHACDEKEYSEDFSQKYTFDTIAEYDEHQRLLENT